MVVAVVALFVALGGTAAAVTVDFARNADKVDGRHANQLIRLSSGQVTADVNDWNGATITDSRTIKAPKKGLLLITYTFDSDQDLSETAAVTDGYVSVSPKLDGTLIGGVAFANINFSQTCCDAATLTVQRTVHVNAGSHTVSVEAVGPGPGGGGTAGALVYVYERALSVVYVPFKGDGSVGRVVPLKPAAPRTQPQR